jgi:hypothetical protein
MLSCVVSANTTVNGRHLLSRDLFTVQGGEDDLRSGLVYEANGTTTLMFRHYKIDKKTFFNFKNVTFHLLFFYGRKAIKSGVADQPFGGLMHFIWATGQDKVWDTNLVLFKYLNVKRGRE